MTATTAVPAPTRSELAPLGPTLARGALGGMAAAAAMAMIAMVAAATYQHHGFFTPLFHISSLFGSTDSMMRSMQEAAAGNRFWFTPGAALVGMMIHMVIGAMYGMAFALIARVAPRKAIVAAGAAYGLFLFATAAWVDLPAAASVAGAGDAIADMASMVGYPTFAFEHLVFGIVLAGSYLFATRRDLGAA